MAPILKFATSSGSKKKEPRYICQKSPSKSPARGPPPCSPSRVPKERDALSLQPMVCSIIYNCRSPQKGPFPLGKQTVNVHGAPRERKAYVQRGAALFSKRIVNNTAITTPLPCSLQQDTFHIGLCRPERRLSACVAASLKRVLPPHLLSPPTWPGVE
jgi:hypothetical protein